jgi:hypothetical protein
VCRESAPGLVQVFHKFKDRDVKFVSLTSTSRDSVQRFVDNFSVPWPSGYGASSQFLADLGAFKRDTPLPGYEVTPTIYVLGPDGRIAWCDRNARLRHEDQGPMLRELEMAITQALEAAVPATGPAEVGEN